MMHFIKIYQNLDQQLRKEDKIALIKLSLKEIENNELVSSFSELMKKESDK